MEIYNTATQLSNSFHYQLKSVSLDAAEARIIDQDNQMKKQLTKYVKFQGTIELAVSN